MPAPEAAAIREQLNRLLAHPLFSHSKRYPVFLSYTVEQTLLGNGADLKERTIGIEAFERLPEYDVNRDPVVRTSAAEVRKRLIQYYYDDTHTGELVIELMPGSYVPVFREPDLRRLTATKAASEPETSPHESFSPAAAALAFPPEMVPGEQKFANLRWIGRAVLLLLALAAGIAIGRHRTAPPPSSMERFWEPITSSQGPITYCIGEPGTPQDLQKAPLTKGEDPSIVRRLSVSDVLTLARSIVPLVPGKKVFRVVSSSEVDLAQLREGPVVLIGAFSNLWTLRVTEKLRFGFEIHDGIGRLVDRKSSPPVTWALQRDASGQYAVRDYAVVARIHDDTTGQPVIVIAGILGEGTEAAGELLYNPVYLDSLLQKVPKNWDRMNLEALIETNVIEGHPGPPNILAVETW